MELDDQRRGLFAEEELPCTAIARIAAPLDQHRFLQLVDDAAQRDRLDVHPLGKIDLPLTWLMVQVCEHAPLRTGDSEFRRTAIEGSPQRVRGLADIPG